MTRCYIKCSIIPSRIS